MKLNDIAQLCGVSASTVSKILHNKDENISEETRKRVLATVKEYQYMPYSKSVKNRIRQNSLIGVLMDTAEDGFDQILFILEKIASKSGYSIVIVNTDGDTEKAKKHINLFKMEGMNGLITIFQPKEVIEMIEVPTVAITKDNMKMNNLNIRVIEFNIINMMSLATQYLIERGHTRIGCIFDDYYSDLEKGYNKALQENTIPLNLTNIYKNNRFDEDQLEKNINDCLNSNITAIITQNVEMSNKIYNQIFLIKNLLQLNFLHKGRLKSHEMR